MIALVFSLLSQVHGDTLRWYDPETAGWSAIGVGYSDVNWAIILPIDSELDGRTVHSGRVHIWQDMGPYKCTMRLCYGTLDSPTVVLDSDSFLTPGWGFYEVLFGDSIVLNQGDLIWLWCSQPFNMGQYPAGVDSGPAVLDYGDLIYGAGSWGDMADMGLDYNWVMELILTPQEVQEGPLPGPPEELTLLWPRRAS